MWNRLRDDLFSVGFGHLRQRAEVSKIQTFHRLRVRLKIMCFCVDLDIHDYVFGLKRGTQRCRDIFVAYLRLYVFILL